MTKEQGEVLNIVQEVLRGVVMACGAVAPDRIAAVSAILEAQSHAPGIEDTSRAMLRDLASGPAMFAATQHPRQ